MSTTTHTLTNTDGRAEAFASAVNALTGGAGHRVHMNGREVLPSTLLDRAACAYGTGSVSVRVRARKGTGFAQLWVKTGETAEFTVTPR